MTEYYESPDGVVVEVNSPIEAVNLNARGYARTDKPRPAKSTSTPEKKEK